MAESPVCKRNKEGQVMLLLLKKRETPPPICGNKWSAHGVMRRQMNGVTSVLRKSMSYRIGWHCLLRRLIAPSSVARSNLILGHLIQEIWLNKLQTSLPYTLSDELDQSDASGDSLFWFLRSPCCQRLVCSINHCDAIYVKCTLPVQLSLVQRLQLISIFASLSAKIAWET